MQVRHQRRFVIATALLSALLTVSALTFAACASQAARHPHLSPVGLTVSPALDVLTAAETASKVIKASVDSGAVPMSQTIATTLNVLSQIGTTCGDLGTVLAAYTTAADAVAKAKATTTLNGKILILNGYVAQLPATLAAGQDALADLKTKFAAVKALVAAPSH